MLNPHVFRAYDVRGSSAPISTPTSSVSRTRLRDPHPSQPPAANAVGQDNRLSSNELKAGFVDGVRPPAST